MNDLAEPEVNSPEWITQKLRRFNISSLAHTFDAFYPDANTKQAASVLRSLSNGELNKQFILIYGTVGCGKTHLIEATILNWAEHGIYTRYQTFSEMARTLKAQLGKGGDHYESMFNRYSQVKHLVVDDFGMGTTESRFEISDLEDIIDLRYRKRYYPGNEMVTILASNKDIKDLPTRVVSRFFDQEYGTVLYMGDRDYRRRSKQ